MFLSQSFMYYSAYLPKFIMLTTSTFVLDICSVFLLFFMWM